jgi:hypothetical protein
LAVEMKKNRVTSRKKKTNPSGSRIAPKPLLGKVPRWALGAAVLALGGAMLFFRLGTLPAKFESWESAPCRLGIGNYVFHRPLRPISWRWSGVASDEGSFSGPQALLVEAGLRLCGANLLGIRLLPALLALLALSLVGIELGRRREVGFAALFVALLASSPFYLYFARSGNFAGTTLSLSIFACYLFYRLLISRGAAEWGWGLATGCVLALLPFFYLNARPIPLVIGCALLAMRPLPRVKLAAVLIGFFLCVPYPYALLPSELRGYFNARGESLVGAAVPEVGSLVGQFLSNALALIHHLLALDYRWRGTLVSGPQTGRTAVYPLYLVPFFWWGLIGTGIAFRKAPGWREGWPLLALAVGCIGPLGVAVGNVNAMRMYLLVFPIYYFVAEGIRFAWARFPHVWVRGAIGIGVLLAVADQGVNAMTRERGLEGAPYEITVVDAIRQIAAEDPKARLVVMLENKRDPYRIMIYGGPFLVGKLRDQTVRFVFTSEWDPSLRAQQDYALIAERPLTAYAAVLPPPQEIKEGDETFQIYRFPHSR